MSLQSDVPRKRSRVTPTASMVEPSAWPTPDSHADLHIADVREQPTGPVPVVPSGPTGLSDGAKLLGGSAGLVSMLALFDRFVAYSGLTAEELAKELGPWLGVLYMSWPVVAAIVGMAWLLLRGYRREQEAHRRRDHRLQHAFVNFGRGIQGEIGGLREDVSGFTTELGRVKEHVEAREARIIAEVGAAARAATDRADRTDGALADLRAGQAQLDVRVTKVEQHTATTPPTPARRDAVPTSRRRVKQ